MSRLFITLAVASLCAATVADAQPMGRARPPAPPMGNIGGQGMGPGIGPGTTRGGASPAMMTCRGELASLCGGQMGMPGVQCLMDNITDISEPCADALSTAMENMEQGHGNDGAEGGDDNN